MSREEGGVGTVSSRRRRSRLSRAAERWLPGLDAARARGLAAALGRTVRATAAGLADFFAVRRALEVAVRRADLAVRAAFGVGRLAERVDCVFFAADFLVRLGREVLPRRAAFDLAISIGPFGNLDSLTISVVRSIAYRNSERTFRVPVPRNQAGNRRSAIDRYRRTRKAWRM